MRTGSAVVASLLGGVLVLASTTVPGPTAAATVVAAPDRASDDAAIDSDGSRTGTSRDLTADVVGPAVGPGLQRWRIRKWPGRTIRYHETIPVKWDWSLDQAIRHWNESGGGIKFVESGKAKARLTIRYGDTGGAAGVGTLGFQHTNYVHLSPAYKHADEHAPEIRVWVGRLFTHELGHVLGFNHTRGQCSLMYPIYDFGLCPPLPVDAPGYYNCRWIDKPLLRRFVTMYGGRGQQSPRLCLIEALPEPLRDVRFSGGQDTDAPVRVSWQPPGRVRQGTKVWITVWKASSCSREPDTWERRIDVDPQAGTWTDPRYGQGIWCYRVEIINRYGAGRPADVREIERWAPVPDAPEVGSPSWQPEEGRWRFAWSAPAGTDLAVVSNWDDPETCPTDTDGWSSLSRDGGNAWVHYAGAATECVLLVAATAWGTVSPPTTVVLQVPRPSVTPTVGNLTYEPTAGSATVTANLASDLYQLRVEVVPGACPSEPPADAGWWDGYEAEEGVWTVYPESDGPHCVLFAALDQFQQHGPVVTRTFTVPGG